jgi:hypothetical protein
MSALSSTWQRFFSLDRPGKTAGIRARGRQHTRPDLRRPDTRSVCLVRMTLEPGDLVLTGTPPGVGYFRDPRIALRPGDTVEVEVQGIGKLRNPVVG